MGQAIPSIPRIGRRNSHPHVGAFLPGTTLHQYGGVAYERGLFPSYIMNETVGLPVRGSEQGLRYAQTDHTRWRGGGRRVSHFTGACRAAVTGAKQEPAR